jgi:WD40 repeat protein
MQTQALQVHKLSQLTGHQAALFALTADSEPGFFFSSGGDGWLVRWNVAEPDMGRLLAKTEAQVFSLLHLPSIKTLVAGTMHGGLHWIPLEEGGLSRNLAHHQRGVFALIAAEDWVFSAGGEGILSRWSVADGRVNESLHLSNRSLRTVDYCAARRELAVGSSDASIYVVDADTFSIRFVLSEAHSNSVFSVRYSPDGQYLLSGGRDAYLRVWDCNADFRQISAQPAHWYTINSIAWSPDGNFFATASRDRTIKIWDSKYFQLKKVLDSSRYGGHIRSVNTIIWLQDPQLLVSGSDDRSAILWQIK